MRFVTGNRALFLSTSRSDPENPPKLDVFLTRIQQGERSRHWEEMAWGLKADKKPSSTLIPETVMQQEIEIAASKTTEQKFSITRVAQVIGVHPATVSRLMDSGKLGYYQIGTRRIVGQTHLEQYLLLAERKAKVLAIH